MLKDKDGTPHALTRAQAIIGLAASVVGILAFFVPAFMNAHDNALRMEIRLTQQDTEISIIKSQIAEDRKLRAQDHDILVGTAYEVRRVTNWLDSSPGGMKSK